MNIVCKSVSHAGNRFLQFNRFVNGTRRLRLGLLSTVSSVTIAVTGFIGATSAVHAASYEVSNQAELISAITSANSAGGSSTIIMTQSFSVNPTTLPAIEHDLTIEASGFTLTSTGNFNVGTQEGGSLSFNDGEFVSGAGMTVASATGTTATLNISGPQTTANFSGLQATLGTGYINIYDGAVVASVTGALGGIGTIDRGGEGIVTISGEGSTWAVSSFLNAYNGSLSVLDGGEVSATSVAVGITAGKTVSVLVDGENSRLIGTNDGSTAVTGSTEIGRNGNGVLTLRNGGSAVIGTTSSSILKVATNASGTGTINIGGAVGEAATRAGTLDVETIIFGAGQGSLNFNHTESSYAFDVALAGNGTINQTGSGKTVLTNDQLAFTGQSFVRGGILAVNGVLNGSMNVVGGRLEGVGTVGSTIHEAGGIIAPGNSIGTLTIDGDYHGAGGLLEIETVLGGDNSETDLLAITGNTTGTANVSVINLGGTGSLTTNGIKVIDVGGLSDAIFLLQSNETFEGDAVVVAGAYAYRLVKNGVDTPEDGDWYLRSTLKAEPETPGDLDVPLYQSGAPLYEAYPQVLLALNALPTLQQRVGNRYWNGESGAGIIIDGRSSIWGRIEGSHSRFDSRKTTTGTDYDVDLWKLQAGVDGQFYDGEAGKLIAGLTGHYGKASSDVTSVFGQGKIEADGYGVGGTLSWYGTDGLYADGQAQATWFDSDLTSADGSRGLVHGNKGFGYAFSAEAGKRIALSDELTLTPQGQLVYSSVDFDTFDDRFGSTVSAKDGESLEGRVGLAVNSDKRWQAADGSQSKASVYGLANLYYQFLGGTKVDLSGVEFVNANDRFSGGVGLGGSFNWADGKYSLYGEGLLKASLAHPGNSFGVNGTVGLKVSF